MIVSNNSGTGVIFTADDPSRLDVVERIIPEPISGAHAGPALAVSRVGDAVEAELEALIKLTPDALRDQRAEGFYAIGKLDPQRGTKPAGPRSRPRPPRRVPRAGLNADEDAEALLALLDRESDGEGG